VTLRARLVAILAALVAIGLAISGVLTYGALKNFLLDRVDEQVRAAEPIAVRVLVGSLTDEPELPGPPNLPIAAYAELRDSSGETIQRVAFGFQDPKPAYPPDLPERITVTSETGPFTVGSTQDPSYEYRVIVSPTTTGGTLVVAIPLVDVRETLHRLIVIELVVAVALLAAIGAVAWVLIRRELRPLDRMAEAASVIASGDLTRRVEEGDDRTEVGRLGRAFNVMLERIETAFAARRESEDRMRTFLADASHELRTPLTSIRGYAELFRRGADRRPEDIEVSMRRIEDEAARMGILVEDLLLLANADRTRPLDMTEVDVSPLLSDVAEDARARDPDRAVTVRAPDSFIVAGDVDRLRQAITNLVANALVHTPPGTPIEISLAADDRWTKIAVTDSGPGLSPDALEHAFDRFWREDPSRSRNSGGGGLGLAIVDAIARGHGGKATAEDLDGRGARFTLWLPLSPSEEPAS
jgi:two-component system, OmpR family, sensor kinase